MIKYLLASVASAGVLAIAGCEAPSTIGGHEVPSGLSCQEDEVIGFDENTWAEGPDGRMSHQLGCIHIDSIRYPAVPATPPASDVTVCSSEPELCTSPDVGD